MRKRKVVFFVVFMLSILFCSQSTVSDLDKVKANEEFRWGVVAYHQGFYNKAILSFERALALNPERSLVRDWMGRTYYKSGIVDAALYEWSSLIEAGLADSSHIAFHNTVKEQFGLGAELRERGEWAKFFSYQSEGGRADYFRRPISVVPLNDGTGDFYITSYISNEIVRITPGGKIIDVFKGGLDGYDHPFDILILDDGEFLVSEFSRDIVTHCSKNGMRKKVIGKKGVKEGELLGPQFLAGGDSGYFYVTDYGNRRVVKFDMDGNYILSLGEFSEDFEGFKSPTGIVTHNDQVYVADTRLQKIFIFDHSGNYISTLIDEGLSQPEGLYLLDSETLLIADSTRLMLYDIVNQNLTFATDLDKEAQRITDVCEDANGNIVVADFNGHRVDLVTELQSLYSGLFLRIESINSKNYPQISFNVSVMDRYGDPIVGLDESNFVVREGESYIDPYNITMKGFLSRDVSLSILLDSELDLGELYDDIDTGIKDILSKLNTSGDSVSFLRTADQPELLTTNRGEIVPLLNTLQGEATGDYSLDKGIRLAASKDVLSVKKKTLVLITDGDLRERDFANYDVVELANFLKINNTAFYPLYCKQGERNESLNYLAESTGGRPLYIFDEKGAGEIVKETRNRASGVYTFSYTSKIDTDFGRSYIPITLEAVYVRKSGQDKLGFFAPPGQKVEE